MKVSNNFLSLRDAERFNVVKNNAHISNKTIRLNNLKRSVKKRQYSGEL